MTERWTSEKFNKFFTVEQIAVIACQVSADGTMLRIKRVSSRVKCPLVYSRGGSTASLWRSCLAQSCCVTAKLLFNWTLYYWCISVEYYYVYTANSLMHADYSRHLYSCPIYWQCELSQSSQVLNYGAEIMTLFLESVYQTGWPSFALGQHWKVALLRLQSRNLRLYVLRRWCII